MQSSSSNLLSIFLPFFLWGRDPDLVIWDPRPSRGTISKITLLVGHNSLLDMTDLPILGMRPDVIYHGWLVLNWKFTIHYGVRWKKSKYHVLKFSKKFHPQGAKTCVHQVILCSLMSRNGLVAKVLFMNMIPNDLLLIFLAVVNRSSLLAWCYKS